MVYPIARFTIRPITMLWVRKVEGLENVPKSPFIIAANHSSYFDSLLLPSAVYPRIDKNIHALVNSFYWKPALTRFFLNRWEAIPVYVKEKGSKKKNKKSTGKALSYLKNNELVMIFPEGTRNDGKLKKAYNGVARIALNAKVPVLPVGLVNTNKILRKGKMLPGLERCEVKIGKPMHFEKYKPSEKSYNKITRKIMKEIAKLINQKYNY